MGGERQEFKRLLYAAMERQAAFERIKLSISLKRPLMESYQPSL
jgi:hypothetical protein